MNIVSSCDSDFYHCAVQLANSVKKYYGKQLILYDMGLTKNQSHNIDATIIPITVDQSYKNYASLGSDTFIQAIHKPYCIKDYFEKISSKPIIFLDADCLFTQKVIETGFDIGVTLRSTRVQKDNPYNGLLNSGVIFLNKYSPYFIQRWIDACREKDATDQSALCKILGETIDWNYYNHIYDWCDLKIKVFGTDEYNDYHLENGKIFHFKGLRHEKDVYEKLMNAYENHQDAYKLYKSITKKSSFYKLLNKLTSIARKQTT